MSDCFRMRAHDWPSNTPTINQQVVNKREGMLDLLIDMWRGRLSRGMAGQFFINKSSFNGGQTITVKKDKRARHWMGFCWKNSYRPSRRVYPLPHTTANKIVMVWPTLYLSLKRQTITSLLIGCVWSGFQRPLAARVDLHSMEAKRTRPYQQQLFLRRVR